MLAKLEHIFLKTNQVSIGIMMGIMFILVFINVVTRYIFGFSFATTEEISTFLVDGRFPALVVPQYLFNGISSFPLMAVPFFILAAEIMTASGLTGSLLRFANDLVGHIRGGLGHVNVLVSMLFAGISGSALADAAGPSAIVMRMMRKAGYSPNYAGADLEQAGLFPRCQPFSGTMA